MDVQRDDKALFGSGAASTRVTSPRLVFAGKLLPSIGRFSVAAAKRVKRRKRKNALEFAGGKLVSVQAGRLRRGRRCSVADLFIRARAAEFSQNPNHGAGAIASLVTHDALAIPAKSSVMKSRAGGNPHCPRQWTVENDGRARVFVSGILGARSFERRFEILPDRTSAPRSPWPRWTRRSARRGSSSAVLLHGPT